MSSDEGVDRANMSKLAIVVIFFKIEIVESMSV